MINVTQTYLPPIEQYQAILKRAWDKNWLTNRGILVQELEEKIKAFCDVFYLTLTVNGTLPLQIAIKTLALEGEIITTPFSYIATTSSIVWENCKPVFVDIHPEYLTIDEQKIAAAISNKTSAILVTHVFGNPCNVEAIEQIAKKHNLKVIYDAAHCFGVKYKGKSIFSYGDVSTCSFHATKIFHTGEGGAMFCKDEKLHQNLYFHHNFGHKGPEIFMGLGINAKMNELQAALGLAVFPYFNKIVSARKKVVEAYQALLQNAGLQFLKLRPETTWNYSYFPVIFSTEADLLKVQKKMNENEIFPRRYFYPSLNIVKYVKGQSCPISEDISKRILCLPLYVGLKFNELEQISRLIIQ